MCNQHPDFVHLLTFFEYIAKDFGMQGCTSTTSLEGFVFAPGDAQHGL